MGKNQLRSPHAGSLQLHAGRQGDLFRQAVRAGGKINTFSIQLGRGNTGFQGGSVVGDAVAHRPVIPDIQKVRQVGGAYVFRDLRLQQVDRSGEIAGFPGQFQGGTRGEGLGKFDSGLVEALARDSTGAGCLVFDPLGIQINPGLGRRHRDLLRADVVGRVSDFQREGSRGSIRHAVTQRHHIRGRSGGPANLGAHGSQFDQTTLLGLGGEGQGAIRIGGAKNGSPTGQDR